MTELELPVCGHTWDTGEPWCEVGMDIQGIQWGFALLLDLVVGCVEMTISAQQNSIAIVVT